MVIRQKTLVGLSLSDYAREGRPLIEQSLSAYLPRARSGANSIFNEALHDALFPGGKRIRPLLTLLGTQLVGGDRADVLGAATAVEYLHNSSLIFDDLPCMDDATSRRGRPPLHKKYGEGVAILVAINLMNAAYGLVFRSKGRYPEGTARACEELVDCVGPDGMLGGQAIDLAARAGTLPVGSHECVETFRNQKTAALIRLSLRLGAILSGAPETRLSVLSQFAELLGNAYQLIDDMLDRDEDTSSREVAGLPLAAEAREERAVAKATTLLMQAKQTIVAEFGRSLHSQLMCEVADYVGSRAPRPENQSYPESSSYPKGHRAA